MALLCLLIPQTCFAAESTLTEHVTSISVDVEKNTIKASLSVTPLPKDYIYRTAFMWGGDDSQAPKSIVESISIVKGKKRIFVPLSAYADLGDPKKALLQPKGHGFQLVIIGGDAAGSYKAFFDFDNDEIKSRKVVSGEFPKDVWEETKFSFNHLDN
jgi:hypothetical protein